MPSPSDPFGVNDPPTPAQAFNNALRGMINAEIRSILHGHTAAAFDDTPDAMLAMELIARGWVAYKPATPLVKEAP